MLLLQKVYTHTMSSPAFVLLLAATMLALVYLFLRDAHPAPPSSDTIVVLPRRRAFPYVPSWRYVRHRRRRRSRCRSCA